MGGAAIDATVSIRSYDAFPDPDYPYHSAHASFAYPCSCCVLIGRVQVVHQVGCDLSWDETHVQKAHRLQAHHWLHGSGPSAMTPGDPGSIPTFPEGDPAAGLSHPLPVLSMNENRRVKGLCPCCQASVEVWVRDRYGLHAAPAPYLLDSVWREHIDAVPQHVPSPCSSVAAAVKQRYHHVGRHS